MRQHAVHRLPVIEGGQVAGVVSLGDLALPDDPASATRTATSRSACWPRTVTR
jgi:signal-transduction protein with cAMP-binding, CBS, and nucleotidyltransferase domain